MKTKNEKKISRAKAKRSLKEKLDLVGKIVTILDVIGVVAIFSLISFGSPGAGSHEAVADSSSSVNETVARPSSLVNESGNNEVSSGAGQYALSDIPASLEGESNASRESDVAQDTTTAATSVMESTALAAGSAEASAIQDATTTASATSTAPATSDNIPVAGPVSLDPDWQYANMTVINSGQAVMYVAQGDRQGKIVAVNAGHGTSGGESAKTWCHPDGTAKVTGGTTAAGSYQAVAVSSGMTFRDDTPERTVTLRMAQILKEKLLAAGYDVLMIRDGEDVQLDNIARTVIANNMADIHIALHWDGDGLDTIKGAFYMSVPDALKSMEPVASHWQSHEALGDALIAGLSAQGIKIWGSNPLDMDLTQTSYSTIPSVDIELGNQCSDHSDEILNTEADGLLAGINAYFAAAG